MFRIGEKSGQLVLTFLSKYWQKHKKIRLMIFCSVYCINVFWFNIQLAKKELQMAIFICKTLVFVFLPFLNLRAQINVPKISISTTNQL